MGAGAHSGKSWQNRGLAAGGADRMLTAMLITICKGAREDGLELTRADGSRVSSSFPHKGPVPHDGVHFHVEQGLGLKRGFWGMVAEGRDPGEIGALAAAAGHRSASRCEPPDPQFIEIIQAERLVESFEADLWDAGGTAEDIMAMAASGCAMSHVPAPVMDLRQVEEVRSRLRMLMEEWTAAPIGYRLALRWS